MSAVEDYALALYGYDCPHALRDLLEAVRDAWGQAEAAPISENEAIRWSRVCTAAAELVSS